MRRITQCWWSLPTPVWVAALCFVVFGVLLNKTIYGRNTLAIGGNPEAARLAGVNVNMTRIVIFLIQGVIAALAGVILAARITSGQPNAAQGFELNVISACVLGGVSLLGGRATISGVLVGVLIMGTVQNAMNLLNIDAFYQYLVRGALYLLLVPCHRASDDDGSAVYVSAVGFLLLGNTFITNNTITNPGSKVSYMLPTPPGTYLPNQFECTGPISADGCGEDVGHTIPCQQICTACCECCGCCCWRLWRQSS